MILEEREHGLEDGGVELGGGVVVEVVHAGWRGRAGGGGRGLEGPRSLARGAEDVREQGEDASREMVGERGAGRVCSR